MSFLDRLPDLLLKTPLYPLFLLLLPAANDDKDAAWAAARDTILLHDPQSEAEFRLACRLAVFSIQVTYAAAQAGTAGLSPTASVRLRAGATTLAREADKTERRLEKLQQARNEELSPQSAPQPSPQPTADTEPEKTGDKPLSPSKKEEIRRIAAFARKHKLSYAHAWTRYELEKKRQIEGKNATQATVLPNSA